MNLESIILDPSNANFPFQCFQNHYGVLRRAYLDINTKGIAETEQKTTPFGLSKRQKIKNDGATLPEADGKQSFCKGMSILESRKFWSVEFGIRKKNA